MDSSEAVWLGQAAAHPPAARTSQPPARDDLERLFGGCGAKFLSSRALLLHRIKAIGDQLARLVVAVARLSQRHVGVLSKRKQLFRSVQAVLQAPELATGWCNEKEQPAFIEKLELGFPRLCRMDLRVVEEAATSRIPRVPKVSPQHAPRGPRGGIDCDGRLRKKAESLDIADVGGMR